MPKENYKVILFYKFVNLEKPEEEAEKQRKLCTSYNLKGRVLLGKEGINATLEGTEENIENYKSAMREDHLWNDISFKESPSDGSSFTKLKVKTRDEIVTLGSGTFDVQKETAATVTAEEMQKMYEQDEDFAVLDLRNDYEVRVGYFENTVNDKLGFNLQNFRDLPQNIDKLETLKNKKVIAVCTGDIRCEKATCLLKREGFKNLYHLKDGIHDYMTKYPAKNFKGSLFVFDNRMTTPVVDSERREIVGKCEYCKEKCEKFWSDDSVRPSRKVICCDPCASLHSDTLRSCMPV